MRVSRAGLFASFGSEKSSSTLADHLLRNNSPSRRLVALTGKSHSRLASRGASPMRRAALQIRIAALRNCEK